MDQYETYPLKHLVAEEQHRRESIERKKQQAAQIAEKLKSKRFARPQNARKKLYQYRARDPPLGLQTISQKQREKLEREQA